MAYYRRIRELREDNDKTQREVAEYLGTPYQYYAVYEKGGSEIPFERAIALARYYNVSLDYLAELTNVKQNISVNSPDRASELIKTLLGLSDAEKERLAGILQAMISLLK